MRQTMIWPIVATICLHLVTARNLQFDDEMRADSLVLVNKTRRDVSYEGSGDYTPILPMPSGTVTMERMQSAPDNPEKESMEDEGSGLFDAESPKTQPVIDDEFKDEDGMADVIEDFNNNDEEDFPTNDHNRHENTLNVIASEENSHMILEEPEIIRHTTEDDEKEEGSGIPMVPEEEEQSPVPFIPSTELQEEHILDASIDNVTEAKAFLAEDNSESSEELLTTTEELQPETSDLPIVLEKSEPTAEEPTTEIPIELTSIIAEEEESTSTTETTISEVVEEPATTEATEYSTLTEIEKVTTVEDTTIMPDTSPELITTEIISTTTKLEEEPTLVEEINGTVLIPAVLEETSRVTAEEPAPHMEPKSSIISWYYVVGLLALCLVILIAVVAIRNRKRSHKIRTDIGQDRDTEKALLGNGRYKEDSEDNNVKNNEIAPLVIKQNSQINKFEKSPNFSSPKNLNIQTHDKNIEKDNVLKSTQAIIEDDADDAKKEIDDETQDDKKKAVEDLNPAVAEKVVVRTHVDLDSIPRKPIVINRNGHSYLAVPGGETKT